MTGVIGVAEAKRELPQTLETLVEHLSCTPQWEEDREHGLWSVYAPELDVFGQGESREDALNSLIEAAQEYADLYLEDAPFYFKVNRQHHYPFVIALALARGDRKKVTKVLGL